MDNELLLIKKAQFYFDNNEFEKSLLEINNILKIDKNNLKANELLAYIQANMFNYELAINLLKKVCNNDSCTSEALYYLGKLYRLTNKNSEAINYYNKSIKKSGGFFEIFLDLGVIYANTNNFKKAESNFLKALKINNTRSDIHLNLGILYSNLKNYELSLKFLDNALKLDNNCIQAIIELGICYFKTKNYKKALNNFENALKKDKYNINAIYYKLKTLNALSKSMEAIEYFNTVIINKYDNNENILLEIANSYNSICKYELAIEYYNICLTINNRNIECLLNKSYSLIHLKKYDEALLIANEALKINPDSAEINLNLGVIFSFLNNYNNSLFYINKSINLNHKIPESYIAKAELLNINGNYTEAIQYLNIALELDNNNVQAHYNKAISLLCLKKYKNAWKEYRWRWFLSNMLNTGINTNKPLWNGDYRCKKLLIWSEQGIGEQILFSSILQILDFHNFHNNCIISINKKLLVIYERSFPRLRFIERKINYEFDFDEHISMIDFFSYHINTKDDASKIFNKKYLYDDIDITSTLVEKYKLKKNIIIGLTWRSFSNDYGHEKSIDLSYFYELNNLDSLTWLNIQYSNDYNHDKIIKQDIANNNFKFLNNDVNEINDLNKLTSLISICDIVITCSNSTAHLSGAMGKETILLIPNNRGKLWYWVEEKKHSSLYPNVIIFKNNNHEDWSDTLVDIKNYLKKKSVSFG